MNYDGQTRFAMLSNNVAIGAQSACLRSKDFGRVIHIKTPGEPWKCQPKKDHIALDLHNMVDDHPKTLGPELIQRIYKYAKSPGVPVPLLIHCGAGMHRSCTVAVVALMARGLDIGGACYRIIKATTKQYDQEPIFPYWTHAALEEIRRVLG